MYITSVCHWYGSNVLRKILLPPENILKFNIPGGGQVPLRVLKNNMAASCFECFDKTLCRRCIANAKVKRKKIEEQNSEKNGVCS